MVDKRKNLKRKLRRLRAIRRSEERAQAPQTSKTDTLLSSMEALIRKMSTAPTTQPTIISQPTPASAPVIKNEKSKEEIMNDIAKQRELDMVRSQVQYMYDKMNDDLRARRNKGEVMARMEARGTKIKPSAFDIDENDEIYKVQKGAAKSNQQLLKLSQQEIFDEQEIARNERNALKQHLSDNLVTKISDLMHPTPKKSTDDYTQSSPTLQDSPTKATSMPTTKATPKGLKTTLPTSPDSVGSVSSVDMSGLGSQAPEEEEDANDVSKRAANEFIEQSFEQVADAAAKLKVKAKIDEFAQQQHDDKRTASLNQYTKLQNTNNRILDRMNEVIMGFKSLSPDRKLEKALEIQTKRKFLENRNVYLQNFIKQSKTRLADAEWHAKRITAPSKRLEELNKINDYKEKVALFKTEYDKNKHDLDNSSDFQIQSLKDERKDKVMTMKAEINDALNNDSELRKLILERDKLEYLIKTNNQLGKGVGFPTDPYGAREALRNQTMYVERYVEDLNKNGDIEDENT